MPQLHHPPAHVLRDGSEAQVLPNGKILSSIGGLAEFTDSDGTIYTCGPSWQRVTVHRLAVADLKTTIGRRWVSRARARHTIVPIRQRATCRESHGQRRGHRRSRATASGPPGDSDPAEPAPGARHRDQMVAS
jgi:hypothetical protein